jgi:hypothetical protein
MSESRTQALPELRPRYKDRALLVFGVVVYIAFFQWMYIHWLSPVFGYYGFEFNPPSAAYLLLAWVLSLLPSLWMPIDLSRASQLAYWILYFTVLIPSMFVPVYAGISSPPEVAGLMLTLFAGFSIVGIAHRLPLLNIQSAGLGRSRFWIGFGILAGFLALWVMVTFRKNLQLLSFLNIYDVRFAAETVMEGTRLNYALMWLSGAVNPFLMGWGLYQKKTWMFIVGALGQLLVYSSLGTKGSIISVLFIPALYLILRGNLRLFGLKITWSIVALFVLLCVLGVTEGKEPGPLMWVALFVVFMRTFGINGLLTAQYYDFFQSNPQTYYSHVTGVNWFLHYPYSNPMGIEVGSFYSADPTLDSTAHFWAMDGLAALGLIGVLLISVFCVLVFWILDSVARRHDPRLTALVISYAAYNLANISIFTSILSGGLGLLILILYLLPSENSEVSPVKHPYRASLQKAT